MPTTTFTRPRRAAIGVVLLLALAVPVAEAQPAADAKVGDGSAGARFDREDQRATVTFSAAEKPSLALDREDRRANLTFSSAGRPTVALDREDRRASVAFVGADTTPVKALDADASVVNAATAVVSGDAFDWLDAGAGAMAALLTCGLAGAGVLVLHRRRDLVSIADEPNAAGSP